MCFEHPDFYVIHKPVGMPMHDDALGVIHAIRALTGEQQLYLCHRLDTVTSGCLLIGRNASAAAQLSGLFAGRDIQKYYLAILSGKPAKKQGTIAGDMKNRRRGQHVLMKTRENPAVTQFFSHHRAETGRIALVKPLTGKTHQIRVAMKSLGSPILGDTLYGGKEADRVYLHAWQLHFSYNGEDFSITCTPEEGSRFVSEAFSGWLAEQPDNRSLPWPSFTLPEIKSR